MKPAFHLPTASRTQVRLFLPLIGLLSAAHAAPIATAPAATTPAPPMAPVLISELRSFGPGGAQDAFVELFNTRSQPVSLVGWSLRYRDEKGALTSIALAPDARIGARGHLLLTGGAYSLGALAAGEARLASRIGGGVRLCDPNGQTIDAVGPQSAPAIEREGAGLPTAFFDATPLQSAPKTPIPQFSLVRRALDGQPQDSGDNARDFALVSVAGALAGQVAQIGTPGPENASSPRLRPALPTTARVTASGAAENNAAGAQTQTVALQSDPERNSMRRARRERGPLRSFGTMTLRYYFVNETSAPIKKLSFRVNSITNDPNGQTAPAGSADIRLVRGKEGEPTAPVLTTEPAASSAAGSAATTAPTAPATPARRTLWVWKTKLATAPAQPLGGGLNALLNVDLPAGGIAPGARGEIWFSFGVERTGNYRVVLGNDLLNLVFEGNTEDDLTSQETPRATTTNGARRGGQGSITTIRSGGAEGGVGANGGVGEAPGAPGTGFGAEEADGIILEGNTEDGVAVPAVPPSGKAS